jgi:plasmid stabilization system protein ParE
MKPVRLGPEVVAELADAAEWYEAREPGLGDRLLGEVERMLPRLGTRPKAFPLVQDTAPDLEVRRALLPYFPFGLVFVELKAEVRIVAIAHAKRRPGFWLYRVRS